jgi:hypothetical protein
VTTTACGVARAVRRRAAGAGRCVPGGAVYNEAEAERAWATLTAMYKQTLV